jgi:osmoprotectant transport system ATP-binding protein
MARRYPAQLSGGERQRVGVARALAASPPLLLMDEPFGAVDPLVRERLQDEFLALQRRLGTTVVFVTHDLDEAVKMGTRVAVMRGGQLIQHAPPAELLAEPADEFVARFAGEDRALKRLRVVKAGTLPLRPLSGQLPDLQRFQAEDPAYEALALMLRTRANALLVCEGQRPVGVLGIEALGQEGTPA